MALWKYPVHVLAYGFGTGFVPGAPGSAGSLVGVALYWVMAPMRALQYWSITAALGTAGVVICEQTASDLGMRDPGMIVWDEIVGCLFAMYRLPCDWRWLASGFVVYRLFDIWKPYPIGLIEEGFSVGVSIMADDIVAGVYTGCVLHLVHWAMRR